MFHTDGNGPQPSFGGIDYKNREAVHAKGNPAASIRRFNKEPYTLESAARADGFLEAMNKYTAFRCPEELLELAKVKAKKDRRSLSNYIVGLINRDVKDAPQSGNSTVSGENSSEMEEAPSQDLVKS